MRRTQIIGILLIITVLVLGACSPKTITLPPEVVTITSSPEVVTITPSPEVVTITLPPEVITITPPPQTITITPLPPTPTPTPPPGGGIFEVSDLTVEPSEATVGQAVTITATVTNKDMLGGTFVAELKIDGQIVDSQSIYIFGGGGDPMGGDPSMEVEFTFTPSEEGTFSVDIGAQIATLTVTSGATPTPTPTPNDGIFEVSDLIVEPNEATVGQTVTITATVSNVGILDGTFVAELNINGQIVDSQSIYIWGTYGDTMAVPASKVVEFTFTPSEEGTFTVDIGAQIATLTVTSGETPAPTGLALAIEQTVSNPRPLEEENITYTIILTNLSSTAASGVEVTDQLPAGVTFVSYQATSGTYDSSTGVWTVGDLAEFAQATLLLTASLDIGTVTMRIINCATITAVDQTNTNSANNSACADTVTDCGC